MTRLQRRIPLLLALCLSALAIPAATALAAPGDLDTSFSGDGAAFESLPRSNENRDPRVVQDPTDGSLVAAVLSGCQNGCDVVERNFIGDLTVVRMSPSGEVLKSENLPTSDVGDLYDLRVLADGSITIVGRHQQQFLRIIRLGSDLEMTGDEDYRPDVCDGDLGKLEEAQIRADGTIAGLWNNCSNAPTETSSRGFTANRNFVDEVDAAGTLGERTDLSNVLEAEVIDLALRPDGVIHVLGRFGKGQPAVVRLLAGDNGDIDPGYGTDGRAVAEGGGNPESDGREPSAFTVDGAGRATFGLADTDFVWELVRFTSGGQPDTGFGPGGMASIDVPSTSDEMELSSQRDNKLLVVGSAFEQREVRGAGSPGIVVGRILDNGTGDPGFGGDGIAIVGLDDDRLLYPFGPAVQQADGKIVGTNGLPFFSSQAGRGGGGSAQAPEEDASYLMVFRLMGDPPAEQQKEEPVIPPVTPGTTQQQQQQQPKKCTSKRRIRIRLRTGRPKGEKSPIVAARVIVNGKRVKVTRGNRVRARINLTSLPKGRFAVKIRLRLKDGGIVRETRRYRTCTKKIRRQLKPLRTRAPRSSRG